MLLPFNSLPFKIALRYSIGNSNLPFSKLINRMSIIGLTMGVSLLILVLSVMNGFDQELRQRILSVIPHITLLSDKPIQRSEWQVITDNHPAVRFATPYSEQFTMAISGDNIEAISLLAINPELEMQNPAISAIIGVPLLEKLKQNNHIILGKDIAQRLNKKKGDSLTLINSDNSGNTNKSVNTYIIGSLLDTSTELDNKLALTQLSSQNTNTEESQGVRIIVDDLFNTYNIALDLLHQLPDHYYAITWSQTHGSLYQAIQSSRTIVFIMVFLLLAIAAFNVLSSLMILSAEKRKDIAVLKTLGLSQKRIFNLFCYQGMIVGVLGTTIGSLLGLLLAFNITSIIKFLEQLFSIQFLTVDIYPIDYLPSAIHWQEILLVGITAITLSTLAAIAPAWRSMQVQPAEVLRQE